jgi:hypothetical protein
MKPVHSRSARAFLIAAGGEARALAVRVVDFARLLLPVWRAPSWGGAAGTCLAFDLASCELHRLLQKSDAVSL